MTFRIRSFANPTQPEFASNNTRGNKARSSVNNVFIIIKCVSCSGSHGLVKCDELISKTAKITDSVV